MLHLLFPKSLLLISDMPVWQATRLGGERELAADRPRRKTEQDNASQVYEPGGLGLQSLAAF